MTLVMAFGIASLLLTLAKLWWIWRGSRQESRATIDPLPWMIWGVLGIVTLLPQIVAVGWQWAMLLGAANLLVNVSVLWIARTHDWRRPTRGDVAAMVIAGLGIVLWLVIGDAYYGLWFSLIADATGVARIWIKAWMDPWRELIATWLFGATAAAFAFSSAVLSGEAIVVWYPAYVVGNALMSSLIIVIRRRMLQSRKV